MRNNWGTHVQFGARDGERTVDGDKWATCGMQ